MPAEYLTFQEVLTELQIDGEELKRLVSDLELPGFRAGSAMTFKREDVLNLDLDQVAERRETLRRAQSSAPEWPAPTLDLARQFLGEGKLEFARRLANEVLGKAPDHPDARRLLGEIESAAEDPEAAAQ